MAHAVLLSGLQRNWGLMVLLEMVNTSHPLTAHRLLQELQIAGLPRQTDIVFLQNQQRLYAHQHSGACTGAGIENQAGQRIRRRGMRIEQPNSART